MLFHLRFDFFVYLLPPIGSPFVNILLINSTIPTLHKYRDTFKFTFLLDEVLLHSTIQCTNNVFGWLGALGPEGEQIKIEKLLRDCWSESWLEDERRSCRVPYTWNGLLHLLLSFFPNSLLLTLESNHLSNNNSSSYSVCQRIFHNVRYDFRCGW